MRPRLLAASTGLFNPSVILRPQLGDLAAGYLRVRESVSAQLDRDQEMLTTFPGTLASA